MPAVSVLMVFHRDTVFLRPAIASVLAQTFRDFELVLVDNGTGLSPAELGPLGEDARLRWVRLAKNEGIAAGHNAGVAVARGEFIALLDYDDLALPTRLERQVAVLRADPGLGLVSSLAERIDGAGRVGGKVFCLPLAEEHWAYAQYAAPVVTPASAGRRELFRAVPYRADFPYAADLDFQARAVEHWRMAVLPEVLLHYRWYPAQTTQQQSSAIESSRCAINLITARRRAGRSEKLAETLPALAAATPVETCRRTVAFSLSEKFPVLAAYYARRSFALDRSPGSGLIALRLAAQAVRQAGTGRHGHVARMFLTGPVRTLGLRPA